MLINLDDREAEIVGLALRYWRSQRRDSTTRRSDPFVTPDTVDLLLAKLGLSPLHVGPHDDPPDELARR